MCGRNKVMWQDYVKLRIGFLPNGGKRARERVHLSNEEVGHAGIHADARIMPDDLCGWSQTPARGDLVSLHAVLLYR